MDNTVTNQVCHRTLHPAMEQFHVETRGVQSSRYLYLYLYLLRGAL